jgi:MoaA/NifB/PqqE/SkfB family radical SAM enzyme
LKRNDNLPKIKIYNVISNVNYHEIERMLEFALETLVDSLEFQVIDIIKGKTDSLALSENEKNSVIKQLSKLPKRKDYFVGSSGISQLESLIYTKHKEEFMDFGNFFKKPTNKGFILNIKQRRLMCPMNNKSNTIKKDRDGNYFFRFSKDLCRKCSISKNCIVDVNRPEITNVVLVLLGVGSFYRRISRSDILYDSKIVDSLPCYAGWIYSRILTDGSVIPCCKAHRMPMGNLYEKSFREIWFSIWFSKVYNEFRQKAKNLKKSDPYFKKIECYKSCDNLGMNLDFHKKILNLDYIKHIKYEGFIGDVKMKKIIDELNKIIDDINKKRKEEIKKRDKIIDKLFTINERISLQKDRELENLEESWKKRYSQEIQKRDKIIDNLNAEIAKISTNSRQEIQKRDLLTEKVRKQMESEIQKRDKIIDNLNAEIAKISTNSRQGIQKMEKVIGELNASLREQYKIIEEKDNQLQEIFNSLGWKLLTKLGLSPKKKEK